MAERGARAALVVLLALGGIGTMPGPATSQVTPVRPRPVDLEPGLGREQPQAPEGVPAFASPWLPPGHWAEGAVRRLYGLGLLDTYDPGRRRITVRQAAAAFAAGLERAVGADQDLLDLVQGWQSRFAAEQGGLATMAERQLVYHGAIAADWESREGDVIAASPEDTIGFGPVPVSDESGFRVAGWASATYAPYVAVGYTGESTRIEGGEVQELYGVGRWRRIGAWIGRRAPGYGPGLSGAVTMGGLTPIDGGGLFLADPWRAPVLGPVRLDVSLARIEENGGIRNPWFAAARFSAQPHPRFGIGVSRAAMFSGENGEPLTLENVVFLLIGKHGSGGSTFENQIAAVDLWARPPLGSLPLLAWLEWGFDDSAGAWMDVPGIVAGAELAAVPGVEELSLGAEYASFAEFCCGNPPWYTHLGFNDGWTSEGRLIGHPLGGEGTELSGFGRLDVADARGRISARVFRRERVGRNLLGPERLGVATGGMAEALFRWSSSLDLRVAGFLEEGEEVWRETYFAVGARALF